MRFLLERDDLSKINDPKIKHLIMRLHNASLEADLLEKAKLEEEFTQELDMTFAKLVREIEQERKLREEESKLREEECKLKEEERRLREEESRLREEERKLREEERQLKEEAYLEIERLKALINVRK